MLQTINKTYLLVSIFLYLTITLKSTGEYYFVNLYAILSFISYFIILYFNSKMNIYHYKESYLRREVFLYVFIAITFQNFISYAYNDNFFMFSTSDAIFYHENALKVHSLSFMKGINQYLKFMSFDDLGMILILYPLYAIVESNLILNFFYLFVGMVTAVSLFNLSQNFMSKKYAFMASLSYSLSSFVLFFHSTGLKESFMIMLIVLSFEFYYQYIKSKNILNLLKTFLFLGLILLFRPMIAVMIVSAIVLSSTFSKHGGVGTKILAVVIMFVLIGISDSIVENVQTYTTGGIDTLIEARESQGSIKGSVFFSYFVNILSETIGPLPTIDSPDKILTMFYAPGLIYRVLIAFPFWAGIYYIYKNKNYILYPLVLFVLFEMSALAYLMDGLELRKALSHISFVFIIAFWFLDQYDRKILYIRKIKRFNQLFKFSMFIATLLIFYWNFR